MIHEWTMKIQQREKDIENWETIKKFLTIYMCETCIPLFKKKKAIKYLEAMTDFTGDEVSNAKSSQSTWEDFHQLCKKHL